MTRTVQKYLRQPRLAASLLQAAPKARMTFEQRRRSRQQLLLSNRETIHMHIERGQVLIPGDVLVADDGGLIQVEAQCETLMRVTAHSATDLIRAAYHLGNRHVTVQVEADYLQLEQDAVLKDMLQQLGLHTAIVNQPFNPEQGAYGGGHKHGHADSFEEDYSLAQAAFEIHNPPSAHDAQHQHLTDTAPHAHRHP